MKRMLMLAAVGLTLLFEQAAWAQPTAPDADNAAVAPPVIVGQMMRRFARRGKRKYTQTVDMFQSVRVTYDERTRQWNIFTKATGSELQPPGKLWDMWIRYHERTGFLVISQVAEIGINGLSETQEGQGHGG